MSLSWDEVEKSVKEGRKARSGGRRLFMEDGDSADIRFIGIQNHEPYIYKRHFDAKTGRYFICAEDEAKAGDHEGCVCCAIARALRGKTARLKSPQRLYAVSVFDPRKYHYVESKPKGEQYQPCSDDDSCRWCRRNVERKINGVRHWSLAENLVLQLRTFERDTLGKRCRRCGTGRIKVTGFQCPTCETELEVDGDPNEEMRCLSCEKEQKKKPVLVKPKEIVACKNCGPKGRRLTLGDAWITISRSGQKQNTTWNFTVGDIEPFDPDPFLKEFPDLKKIKPINFESSDEFKPLPAGEMAAALGVKNPFGKSIASEDDDEDDEDEDDDSYQSAKSKKRGKDDEDDGDEDEDTPRRKKKRPADDDDDTEDDIFD